MASSSSKPSLGHWHSRFLSLGVRCVVFHSVINHFISYSLQKTGRNLPAHQPHMSGEVTIAGYDGTMSTYRVPIGSKLTSLTVLYEPFF